MGRLVESGPAVNAIQPFILLNQATLHASLPEHRHPWLIRINEHRFTTVIDLKPSLAGWSDNGAGMVTYFGFSAERADHDALIRIPHHPDCQGIPNP